MALFERLYETQFGNVGSYIFRFRGRISFNVIREYAMAKWKKNLTSHGFCLHPDNEHELLINVRYADDILLLVKGLEEGVHILEFTS